MSVSNFEMVLMIQLGVAANLAKTKEVCLTYENAQLSKFDNKKNQINRQVQSKELVQMEFTNKPEITYDAFFMLKI